MVNPFTAARLFSWGGRIPVPLANAIARLGAGCALFPPAGVKQWEENIGHVIGFSPNLADRAQLIENWVKNRLWSLSLANWPAKRLLSRVTISAEHESRLRESMSGPGLILALPHMGSWDAAGAWCAQVGLPVVSVAEKLPGGLFEQFRAAREAMGMKIHPAAGSGLLTKLTTDVNSGLLLCLLADRDLSSLGVKVVWPTGFESTMPPGPALLALRTGADLRVASTRFVSGGLRLSVSERIETSGGAQVVTQRIAEKFAKEISSSPSDWLVLQPLVR